METYWSTETVACCWCVGGFPVSPPFRPPPLTQDTRNIRSPSDNVHAYILFVVYLAVVFFCFIIFILWTFEVTALGDEKVTARKQKQSVLGTRERKEKCI
ncbi:unnamed protein product [Lota lota]